MSGSGINWAICKSAPRSRQITMPSACMSIREHISGSTGVNFSKFVVAVTRSSLHCSTLCTYLFCGCLHMSCLHKGQERTHENNLQNLNVYLFTVSGEKSTPECFAITFSNLDGYR